MISGIIHATGQHLFLKPLGQQRTSLEAIPLTPGRRLEISLAGIWIPVELRVEYDQQGTVLWVRFVTSSSSFCGFVPGMIGRVDPEVQQAPEAAEAAEGTGADGELSPDEPDEALAWDDRGEQAGVENAHFSRPTPDLIAYARARTLQMNLWSRVVQDVIRLRMQMEKEGRTPPASRPGSTWMSWQ